MAKIKKPNTAPADKVYRTIKKAQSLDIASGDAEGVPKVQKEKALEKRKHTTETLALDKSQQRKVSKQTKKIKKGLKDGTVILKSERKEKKLKEAETRGLVYIGHLPHGFFEDELRNYFKQFGKVTNVKVCRSRVSGNSKGFGYIEFEHPEVAKIAAETMNNYVMFKKRLVAEYVPFEKRPKRLFQGKSSNLQHTSVKSRRGKQKHSRNKTLDEQTVARKTAKHAKKLQTKIDKLKNLGVQCNIIPVGGKNTTIKEIKLGKRSRSCVSSKQNSQIFEDGTFKKPSKKQVKSKLEGSSSLESSNGSIRTIKSNKAMLTKSLDSVKTLLNKSSTESQDEETQTPNLRMPKKERKVLRRGIVKAKKEKNPVLSLKPDAIKKLARELIRKKGTPLLTLKQNKPKGVIKKK